MPNNILSAASRPPVRAPMSGLQDFDDSSARESDTISMAETALSHPLLPIFVPARSTACSIDSVVSTPNAIGTPVESDTLATPFDTSPAT